MAFNAVPATPTNSSPSNGATNQSRSPTLTASAFSDTDTGDTHAASQWQVATDSGFSSVVWDSGEDATNKTSTTINATNGTFAGALSGKTKLGASTTYYWHVKYKDSAGGWSSYSTGTSFVTEAAPINKNSEFVRDFFKVPVDVFKASTVGVSEEDSTDSARVGTVRIQDTTGEIEYKTTAGWKKTLTKPASPNAYTVTNGTTDREYDANATTTEELADVLGTLLADLKALGIIG